MKRRVACIDGGGRGVCREEEVPQLKEGQVLIEVKASMISPGSELGGVGALRQKPDPERSLRPFGYTNAGIVQTLGEGVEQFAVGQQVACMGGGYALHADYACVPQNLCAAMPEGVSFVAAASVHLAATALNAIRRTVPLFGENGMVVGMGPVGQLCAQLGRLSGCHIMGVDRFPLRLERAHKAGLEVGVNAGEEDPVERAGEFTRGFGMDFAILAFGGEGSAAFEQVYQSLKKTPDGHHMGRITIVGGAQISHRFAAGLGNVDVRSAARTGPGYHDEAYAHGASYPRVFVEWTTQRNMEECLRAMASGQLQVGPLISHEFELGRIGEAVDLLVEEPQNALGVILKP
jgi:NADPH2:quinone reductase